MTAHADHPKALPIKAGQDARFELDVKNDAGVDTDYTNATSLTDAVEFCPDNGPAFTKDLVLDGDPATAPQLLVDVVPGDTSALVAPQRIDVYVTVTKSGGKVDLLSFWFDLIKGTC